MKEKSTLKDVANNYLTHTKSEKGITLIALVITIIVLLILAGVSIAALGGQNGILTNSTEAKKQSEIGDVKDGARLEINAKQVEKLSPEITDEELEEILVKYGTLKGEGNILDQILVTKNGYEVPVREIWDGTTTGEKISLGKLSDVVKVGDYINYAPNYSNAMQIKDGLGNGWRVAYVDSASGVVTLISEGVPLSVELTNGFDAHAQTINFDSEIINKTFDDTVADNIDILTIEDIQLLCNQAGYTLTHEEANTNWGSWEYEEYNFSEDDLNIIYIEAEYLLNTIASDGYGKEHYLWNGGDSFIAADNTSNVGVRLVVDLKSDLEYYGGTGTQGNSYQIY